MAPSPSDAKGKQKVESSNAGLSLRDIQARAQAFADRSTPSMPFPMPALFRIPRASSDPAGADEQSISVTAAQDANVQSNRNVGTSFESHSRVSMVAMHQAEIKTGDVHEHEGFALKEVAEIVKMIIEEERRQPG